MILLLVLSQLDFEDRWGLISGLINDGSHIFVHLRDRRIIIFVIASRLFGHLLLIFWF